MTDDEFLATVIDACRRVPNAEAVALGGSRARGDHRTDSDWDSAVYYRGDIDVSVFERLGWDGRVHRPFEWGQVMYGGAVFEAFVNPPPDLRADRRVPSQATYQVSTGTSIAET